MSEWKDIESAPKDGTRIIAWAKRIGWEATSGAIVVCAFHGHRWAIMGALIERDWPDTKDECTPLFWQPCPSPPETGGV